MVKEWQFKYIFFKLCKGENVSTNKIILGLLEDAAARAWHEEDVFIKSFFKHGLKNNSSICQGASRNVYGKLLGVFPCTHCVVFDVQGKTHIVVFVKHITHYYVVDTAIRQFLPNEKRRAFMLQHYPFKEEIKTAERWNSC